jgi:hypothetical protein
MNFETAVLIPLLPDSTIWRLNAESSTAFLRAARPLPAICDEEETINVDGIKYQLAHKKSNTSTSNVMINFFINTTVIRSFAKYQYNVEDAYF